MVYGHLVALVVRVFLQLYLARWKPSATFSRDALRELIPVGLGLQTKRLLEYASTNLDNLVVGRVLGMAGLGLYDKAFTTMNKIVVRLTLGQAPFRIFSIIHEDAERFRRAYSRLILSITLLGYPVLAGCIVAAEPLFLILYGEKWLAAVFPFQLLCAGGMLKLLNAYASQANEAVGNVWRQVARQALGTVLVVLGAAAGSVYWGLAGAAIGVLGAMAVLTLAMQGLVREATGLSWREMMAPQVPAMTCAALLVGVLLATAAVLRAFVSEPAAWQLLLAQATTGGFFYAAFVLVGPFAAVHEVVSETLDDLVPAGAARVLNRVRRLRR
jgi:O-antigen/teichoic acid export membrane protein